MTTGPPLNILMHMQTPAVRDHFDYRTFLAEFVERKRSARPSWSLGTWASTLGLGGTASISRVLSGERIPGDDLVQSLSDFFEFEAGDAAYFQRLVNRERYYRRDSIEPKPALTILNAKAVDLVGVVCAESCARLLENFGLIPFAIDGQVTASININTYRETPFGPYSESHVCIAAKPVNGGMLDAGLFFTAFACSQPVVIAALGQLWSYECELEETDLSISPEFVQAQRQGVVFSFSAVNREWSPVDERYELSGYSQAGDGYQKTKFLIDTLGRSTEFNNDTDTFNLQAAGKAGEILQTLGFRPLKWVVHENLFSVVAFPSVGSQKSSF